MKTLYTIALSVLFSFTLFAAQGFAQSATTTASGTVLAPLTIEATSTLDFGTQIFPGHPEVVLRGDAGSAQFDIGGEGEKLIEATFTLPPVEGLAHATEANTFLPIAFSTTDGGHATATTTRGGTGFDPSGTLQTALGTDGALFIWLGGTVDPATDQFAGTYSGDIILDIVYVGE